MSSLNGLSRGAELAKFGAVRLRYHWPAQSLQSHGFFGLQALLMIEIYRQVRSGPSGCIAKLPKGLRDWAWNEAGYCLDAPDEMPAGACRAYELEDDISGAEQLTFAREPW